MNKLTRERRAALQAWVDAENHTEAPRPSDVRALLSALDAAEAPKALPDRHALKEHIEFFEGSHKSLPRNPYLEADYGRSHALAIIAELHNLYAILADKKESVISDVLRQEARKAAMRDVAAWLAMLAAAHATPYPQMERELKLAVLQLVSGKIDAHAAAGDLEPYYARVDAMVKK